MCEESELISLRERALIEFLRVVERKRVCEKRTWVERERERERVRREYCRVRGQRGRERRASEENSVE